jgi:hypothetical protein
MQKISCDLRKNAHCAAITKNMSKETEPQILVARAMRDLLRGLRLSDNPRVAAVAAQREAEESDRLQKLESKGRRRAAVAA